VVAARPITSTVALAGIVRDAIPQAGRRQGGHPATRTFQALRIAVNGELDALEAVLPQAVDRLAPDGICVALSYHSLEDRLVKRAFAAAMTGCICPPNLPICACGREPLATALVRRSEQPDAAEIAANPRASAARLRAIRRTAVPPHALDPQAGPTTGPDRSTNR
jgi:16S rRNA (cytosine1402-N4)-methyltransferase